MKILNLKRDHQKASKENADMSRHYRELTDRTASTKLDPSLRPPTCEQIDLSLAVAVAIHRPLRRCSSEGESGCSLRRGTSRVERTGCCLPISATTGTCKSQLSSRKALNWSSSSVCAVLCCPYLWPSNDEELSRTL